VPDQRRVSYSTSITGTDAAAAAAALLLHLLEAADDETITY